MNMTPGILLLGCVLLFLAFASCASAAIVKHTLNVQNLTVEPLCQSQVITAVNGGFPGPTIRVNEGDTLVVHVFNKSPHNMTIHWHGIHQFLSGWADGPEHITQCPIIPGNSYTYKFNVTRQEGTLWWHAHISYLRATVYGALIIHPRKGRKYPFPRPFKEVPILLGEWWNADVIDVVNEATLSGRAPVLSDAFTINGMPGDLYNCSASKMFKLEVKKGKTYLLRMVNAAMQNILYFKIANHNLTVVAIDASYTNPYVSDVIVIAPGQTIDMLLKADHPPSSYYMATSTHQGSTLVAFNEGITRGLVVYNGASSSSVPIIPELQVSDDNATANKFFSELTALTSAPFWSSVPDPVDDRMFITVGVGLIPCDAAGSDNCPAPFGQRFAASMNNVSFEPPTRLSLLQAFFDKVDGIYTNDFPDEPPVKFDYTNQSLSQDLGLLFTTKGTRVRTFKYNSTVEIVFQNTALGTVENHPIHLHGYDFHILAQGVGNYDPQRDVTNYNLKNPQIRNTVAVPTGGWAAIRFRANNPGMWFIHCHLEVHMPWGLSAAFAVENGPTPSISLPPPPPDLPQC